MPSAAFLKAAREAKRRPVLLLAVESPAAHKASLSTRDDWQGSSELTGLNTATEPGSVFLQTDGPTPYASFSADPGTVEVRANTPVSFFSAADWTGKMVGESHGYQLDLWTAWSRETNDHASLIDLKVVPHLYDGEVNALPIVTAAFSYEIWGKLNGGLPQRLAANLAIDDSKSEVTHSFGPLPPGAWSFALRLTSKTSVAKSAASGFARGANTVYDNDGPSYLELRSFAADYAVHAATPTTGFDDASWLNFDPELRIFPLDIWSAYTPATGNRTTEATLVLRPHMVDGYVLQDEINTLVTASSFTFEVWGRLDGGAPQKLLSDLIVDDMAPLQTVRLSALPRGSWSFALHLTQKVATANVNRMPEGPWGSYDNVGPSYLEIYSFTTNQQVSYLPSGTLTSAVLDLGFSPASQPVFQADHGVPAGCVLAYAAWGSENGTDWQSLGAVADGQALGPFRYYRFHIDFHASPDGLATPTLRELRVLVGSFQYYSSVKDVPVPGAKPYLVEGSLNTLSSSIELMAFGKVGEVSPRLHLTREVSDLIATGYLKNKAVTCKIGFVGLPESDFEPYFAGTWYDYAVDHEKMQVTIQTRDVWKQIKTKVPAASYWTDQSGRKVDGKVYRLSGNIIDVMLAVASEAGVSDRFIDRASFLALRDASFPDADWTVKRELTSSQDADQLLGDLAIGAGVFLFPDATGRLTAVHYETALAGEPAEHLDALKVQFKPVQGGQKELYTRQAISYQLLPGKEGGSDSDFASLYEYVNNAAEEAWGESHTKSWRDVWGLPAAAIEALAKRMDSWFATPRHTVQAVNLPPRYLGGKPGTVVSVDNLRLPAPAADWPGYVTGKKYLVMQKGINPNDLTLTLDLFELPGPTEYLPGELPSYHVWERFPAVVELSVAECVVQRATGGVDDLIILRFAPPTDYVYGSAEIWLSVNGGPWSFFAPASFAAGERAWVEVPCIVGYRYQFAVLTVNSAGLRQSLEQAPHIEWTAAGVSTVPYTPPSQHDPDEDGGGGGDHGLPVVILPPGASSYPAVTGLSLTGQVNATEFEGGSASFSWNRYSFTMEVGPADGPAGAPLDNALKGYAVTVLNPDGSRRHSVLLGPVENYSYSYDQNYADGNGVPARQFIFQVCAVGLSGQVSREASLTVANPAPPAIGEVSLTSFIGAFNVSFQPPAAPDLAGYLVHGVPASGLSGGNFVPTENNLLYSGSATSALIDRFDGQKLAPGVWYLKVAAYDSFGSDLLNWSALYSVELKQAADELLDALNGGITEDLLAQDLARRIDLIDTPVTGLVDMTDALRIEVEDPDTGLKVQTARLQSDIHDPATGLIKKIDAVEVTINDPDTGLVQRFDTLDATVNDPATGVLARISGLDASINDPESGIAARQAELEQTVLDPANGLAKKTEDLQASVGDDHAALQVEQSVRAAVTAPEWAAGSYQKGATVLVSSAGRGYLFQSKVDSNTAAPVVTNGVAVESAQWKPVTANLYAQMMLKTDVNGHVVGIGLANDGVTGEVAILAPKFKVVNPDLPEESMQVFTVGTIGGQPTVGIDGALVLDGTLVVGGNVEMGPNAVIQWSNLSEESKTNLTGPDGQSVFVTYHNNAVSSPPATPTGDGTTGGWHTNATSSVVWISQKVAGSATAGSWGTPVAIKGPTGPTGPAGTNSITVVLSNESHAVPCDSAGTPTSYAGSGTDVYVFENDIAFSYGTAIFSAYQFTVSVAASGVSAGAISAGTGKAVVGNHSGMTANPASVTYTITARKSDGSQVIVTKVQTLTKAVAGAVGPTPDMTAYMDKATWVTEIGADHVFTGKVAADNILGNVITGKTIQTAAATGNPRRVVIDSSDNSIKFFESGSATARVVIGTSTVSGDEAYSVFGHSGSGNNKIGVYALSYSTTAVEGSSVQGSGVTGVSSLGYGVFGLALSAQPAVYGSNSYGGPGVTGGASSGIGVHGVSSSNGGVFGESTSGVGMQGNSASSYGLVGANTGGNTYDVYAAGAGSNYGPFTGAHDALFELDFTGVPGDIVCDHEVLIRRGISNTLCVVRLAAAERVPAVLGVLAVLMDQNAPHVPSAAAGDEELLQLIAPYRSGIVNALGEGQINVCRDGGNIEVGDYLCSSARPGKGMRQGDDLLHNYTVAKAREAVVWLAGEDDIRQIACTYHCG
jgi:hypothetical protein